MPEPVAFERGLSNHVRLRLACNLVAKPKFSRQAKPLAQSSEQGSADDSEFTTQSAQDPAAGVKTSVVGGLEDIEDQRLVAQAASNHRCASDITDTEQEVKSVNLGWFRKTADAKAALVNTRVSLATEALQSAQAQMRGMDGQLKNIQTTIVQKRRIGQNVDALKRDAEVTKQAYKGTLELVRELNTTLNEEQKNVKVAMHAMEYQEAVDAAMSLVEYQQAKEKYRYALLRGGGL